MVFVSIYSITTFTNLIIISDNNNNLLALGECFPRNHCLLYKNLTEKYCDYELITRILSYLLQLTTVISL